MLNVGFCGLAGNADLEARAGLPRISQLEAAAMGTGHQQGQVQTKTGAARLPRSRRIAAVKRLTDVLYLCLGYAGPVIVDDKQQLVPFPAHPEFHGRGVVRRVPKRDKIQKEQCLTATLQISPPKTRVVLARYRR